MKENKIGGSTCSVSDYTGQVGENIVFQYIQIRTSMFFNARNTYKNTYEYVRNTYMATKNTVVPDEIL
jgi:hypothetical protein